jgi:hypothetical protein
MVKQLSLAQLMLKNVLFKEGLIILIKKMFTDMASKPK